MAIKLKVSSPVGAGGEVYEPDGDGCITVPDDIAHVLIASHGAAPASLEQQPEPDESSQVRQGNKRAKAEKSE